MNILSAIWANSEHTAIILATDQAGAVLVSAADEHDASGGWRAACDQWRAAGGIPADYVVPVDASRGAHRSAMYDEFLKLPAVVRGQFAPIYAAVNLMLDNGDDEGAGACVAGLAVPAEFDAIKSGILSMIHNLPQ